MVKTRKVESGKWKAESGNQVDLKFCTCFVFFLLLSGFYPAAAQEVLLPLQRAAVPSSTQAFKHSSNQALKQSGTQAIPLPFFDDFASGTVSDARWEPRGGATVTMDVSPLAPTVGVATLDALDADGNLYSHASTELFMADTLLSLPVRLDSLTPDDLVLFSFYYLPGGGYGNMWERVGETPDPQDSLFLDFYRPADSSWETVWSTGGVSVDTLMARTGTDWQYVSVRLGDSAYFDSTFRFRFRNYASLEATPKAGKAGNGDYWHLDYVRLYHVQDGEEMLAGGLTRDVAFAAPAPTMLRSYRAMPYRQYNAASMAGTLTMFITNRYVSPLATHYTYTVLDTAGNTVHAYDGGFENAPSFLTEGYQTAPMHATPAVGFAFPTMTSETDYTVVHVIREGTGGDAYPQNDTVRYRQHFGDYYAYDDGSAENGYGLTSTAARLYLAYRFDLSGADTLTAVDIWFNATLDSGNVAIPFYLTLWSVGDDGRPAEVLYRDETRRFARLDGFVRYILESPVPVDSAVFVGFEQSGNDYINLGFDRSLNTSDRIWYLTGTEWQQSILNGSLMIRPAFGAAAALGISDLRPATSDFVVYPNPASDRVYIDGAVEGVELYDIMGRRQMTSRSNSLDISRLPNGVYLLRVISSTQSPSRPVRLIIKH